MINQLKKFAAEKAVDEIESGMIVGLGSGSTFQFALERIAERIKSGDLKDIMCVPSSVNTEREAKRLGIPLITFDELVGRLDVKRETGEEGKDSSIPLTSHVSSRKKHGTGSFTPIDLTIDGADETDGNLNLIKGGGGALLREKVVAQASSKNIIIVDESKISKHLGTNWHVPVEVIRFAAGVESAYLESIGAKVVKRKNPDGTDYITDENNFILDADFGIIKDPEKLSILLNNRAGIVEHGLFIGLAGKIICATSKGIDVIERGLS